MPARRLIVFLRRMSRTATRPRFTRVSVPSQRSVTVQSVPRTVAEEYRPRVRKRPLPLPRRRRTVRFRYRRRAASATLERFPRSLQPENLPLVRRTSVRPLPVRDLRRKKTITLRAGKRYLAKAPG